MHVFLAVVAEGGVLVVAFALLFVSFELRTAGRALYESSDSGFDRERVCPVQASEPRRAALRSPHCLSIPARVHDHEASVALPRPTELTLG